VLMLVARTDKQTDQSERPVDFVCRM